MSFKHILYQVDRESHVATATLDRPEVLNALNPELRADIFELLEQAQGDPDVWVLILTGAGRGFCSGVDLAAGTGQEEREPTLNEILEEETFITLMGKQLHRFDKPLICAVNGVAAGAGFMLAASCDLRVGSSASRFVTIFQERALPPEGGSSFMLSRIVGISRALDMMLTSRKVDGEEAYRIGLLDRLVDPDQVQDEARALAQRICELPPAAIRATKRAVRQSMDSSFDEAVAREARFVKLTRGAKHDIKESGSAFFERRKPKYEGR